MNFMERITGSDMTEAWKGFEAQVKKLPPAYREAWEEIKTTIWKSVSDTTGRRLIPLFGGVLELLEESAAEGQEIPEVFGDDIKGFCTALIGGTGAQTYRDRWRRQLNTAVARRLGTQERDE